MSASTALTVTTFLALGAAGAGLYSQNRGLARRLDELTASQGSMAVERQKAALERGAGGPTLEGAAAPQARVEALEQQVTRLTERVLAQEGRGGAASGTGEGKSQDPAAFEQGVREVLDRVQQEPEFRQRVAEAAGKPAIEKKPTFARLSQYLKLDASQETNLRRDLEEIQGSLMALLAEERPDGRVLLEEIGKVNELPEGDPGRSKVFLDLFKLRIPGTEQTYVERALELATAFRKKADGYLRPEQREAFSATEIDLFGVSMQ